MEERERYFPSTREKYLAGLGLGIGALGAFLGVTVAQAGIPETPHLTTASCDSLGFRVQPEQCDVGLTDTVRYLGYWFELTGNAVLIGAGTYMTVRGARRIQSAHTANTILTRLDREFANDFVGEVEAYLHESDKPNE